MNAPLATDLGAHAPGPWEMAGPVGHGIWIQSEAHPNIAAVHGAGTALGMANARLIAAAPDLLAALKRMAATNRGNAVMHEPGCRCVVHEADAAIAKAEGRSLDPIGDKLRSLPVIGVINVDNPRDPRHKEWKL